MVNNACPTVPSVAAVGMPAVFAPACDQGRKLQRLYVAGVLQSEGYCGAVYGSANRCFPDC